ncbi:hypothetical protein ABK905_10550 [Acerihabitans sp. KWT182]|uniref:Uncharacterized protein n=1 Tax=Acerihabitans sp. KWT182 TaxID=3157919 RepID=A0AAU7QDL1_9GAMM
MTRHAESVFFFGLAGGAISLGLLLPGFLPPQTPFGGGFAALPVILTTIIGGWLSGLIAIIMTLAGQGVALYDKLVIGAVFLLLFAGKIWRKKPVIIALSIALVILACQSGGAAAAPYRAALWRCAAGLSVAGVPVDGMPVFFHDLFRPGGKKRLCRSQHRHEALRHDRQRHQPQ